MENEYERLSSVVKNEFQEKRNKRYLSTRSIIDFAMGVLYIAVGLFMMYPQALGFAMEGFDNLFRYIFGALCMIYGGWRIYRGIKKDYF